MGVYAQNAADLMMIGGYAVSEITSVINDFKKYTTLNSSNFWIDLATNGKKISSDYLPVTAKILGLVRR